MCSITPHLLEQVQVAQIDSYNYEYLLHIASSYNMATLKEKIYRSHEHFIRVHNQIEKYSLGLVILLLNNKSSPTLEIKIYYGIDNAKACQINHAISLVASKIPGVQIQLEVTMQYLDSVEILPPESLNVIKEKSIPISTSLNLEMQKRSDLSKRVKFIPDEQIFRTLNIISLNWKGCRSSDIFEFDTYSPIYNNLQSLTIEGINFKVKRRAGYSSLKNQSRIQR